MSNRALKSFFEHHRFFACGRVRSIKLLDYDLLTTNIYYYDPTVILCFSALR